MKGLLGTSTLCYGNDTTLTSNDLSAATTDGYHQFVIISTEKNIKSLLKPVK